MSAKPLNLDAIELDAHEVLGGEESMASECLDLVAELRRTRTERDEARAEVARLREQWREQARIYAVRWQAREPSPPDLPTEGADA